MYLHLGQSVVIPDRDILGIFDLDNASWAYKTRELLERATALDRDCLRWKRRERDHLEESEDEGDNLPL